MTNVATPRTLSSNAESLVLSLSIAKSLLDGEGPEVAYWERRLLGGMRMRGAHSLYAAFLAFLSCAAFGRFGARRPEGQCGAHPPR